MSTPTAHLERLPKPLAWCLAMAVVLLVVFPWMGSDYALQTLSRMMILAIFAMSLDLLQGVTGLVSLGHAAYFGVAGYVLALVSPANDPVALWWSLPMAMAVSAAVALCVGFLVVRTHGIYFIMVTMAFAQMLFYLVFDNKLLGGSDGLYINMRPSLGPVDLESKLVVYYLCLSAMVLVYLGLRRLLWSSVGRALVGIRLNEHRMKAVGFNTFRYKLTAFTVAGALAGLAGYLWGALNGFVNPELMGFHMSAHAIMMVILGGMGNFAGAAVGAFAFEAVLHLVKDLPSWGSVRLGDHWQLWMGLFIIAVVLLAPKGLLGIFQRFSERSARNRIQRAPDR